MFPIVIVPDTAADLYEQLGSRPKFWYTAEDSFRYLFKEGRDDTGENWAEKVTGELCSLLGLPHAAYDLAVCKNRKGVVTKSFVPPGGRLVHANELLAQIVKKYGPEGQYYKQKQYTLSAAVAILSSKWLKVPIDSAAIGEIGTPLDVFAGYLMLDAWTGNQDRHDENWGLLLTQDSNIHLLPTYDHASGLGSHATDDMRRRRISTGDYRSGMDAYVKRALSAFREKADKANRLSTIDAFLYVGKKCPTAFNMWLQRLGSISANTIEAIFGQIPRSEISDIASEFAQKLLYLNQERLLSYYKGTL